MVNERQFVDVSAWKSFYEDKKNILDRYYTHDAGYEDALDNVDDWMDAQPTVDAVEVVRCKDCKFFIHPTATDGLCELDGKHRIIWLNDDFCSYGERKDNG